MVVYGVKYLSFLKDLMSNTCIEFTKDLLVDILRFFTRKFDCALETLNVGITPYYAKSSVYSVSYFLDFLKKPWLIVHQVLFEFF